MILPPNNGDVIDVCVVRWGTIMLSILAITVARYYRAPDCNPPKDVVRSVQ